MSSLSPRTAALNANDMNGGAGGGGLLEALYKQTGGSEMKAQPPFRSFVLKMRAANFSPIALRKLQEVVDPTIGEKQLTAVCNLAGVMLVWR